MATLTDLQRIAEIQFFDIVQTTFQMEHKLRIMVESQGFIDVHLSRKLIDKFSFHWETRNNEGTIYRYDNFPDQNWSHLSSYPFHFHNGTQNNVEVPPFPLKVIEGFIAFMEFVKKEIGQSPESMS
jgi:hypothetical protein